MNGPSKTISFEVSGEFFDRLTNKLFSALQGDPEDAIKFLLSQAMTAPEPAMRWMRERRLADLRTS